MLSIDKYRVTTRWQPKTNRMTNPQHVEKVSESEESHKQNILCIYHVAMFLEVGS